jgi:hypothetical protein
MQIPFGKEEQISTIDEHGSTVTTVRTFKEGTVMRPIKRRFSIRERVNSEQQEYEAYLRFSDSLDDSKLDPAFCIDGKKPKTGYYYVVKCWTTVEY